MISLLFFLGFLAIGIAFIMTLKNVLLAVRPLNRTTQPSSVWLLLIPLFNLVWQFLLYSKIRDSINAEYRSRGLSSSADVTYSWGVTSATILLLTTIVNSFTERTSALRLWSSLVSLIGIITWVVFWIQMHQHKKQLQRLPLEQLEDSQIFGNIHQP